MSGRASVNNKAPPSVALTLVPEHLPTQHQMLGGMDVVNDAKPLTDFIKFGSTVVV